MRFLIISTRNDVHSAAIKWWLQRHGHEVEIFLETDYPSNKHLSFSFQYNNCVQEYRKTTTVLDSLGGVFDVALMRRRRPPTLSSRVDKADAVYAKKQAKIALDSLLHLIKVRQTWVNPLSSFSVSELKPLQLSNAQSVGFSIPKSLISNNPGHVLEFADALGKDFIVCKTLQPATWYSADKSAVTFTSIISRERLLEYSESIQLAPAIYQEYIEKIYELRVVIIGETCFCAKIDSQKNSSTEIDWRLFSISGVNLDIERYTLPESIITKCFLYMRKHNLLFSCFDFAVDLNGKIIFLENNTMGQFLWLEENTDSLYIFDAFCKFLIKPTKKFFYKFDKNEVIKISDYLSSDEYIFLREKINEDNYRDTEHFGYIE